MNIFISKTLYFTGRTLSTARRLVEMQQQGFTFKAPIFSSYVFVDLFAHLCRECIIKI